MNYSDKHKICNSMVETISINNNIKRITKQKVEIFLGNNSFQK